MIDGTELANWANRRRCVVAVASASFHWVTSCRAPVSPEMWPEASCTASPMTVTQRRRPSPLVARHVSTKATAVAQAAECGVPEPFAVGRVDELQHVVNRGPTAPRDPEHLPRLDGPLDAGSLVTTEGPPREPPDLARRAQELRLLVDLRARGGKRPRDRREAPRSDHHKHADAARGQEHEGVARPDERMGVLRRRPPAERSSQANPIIVATAAATAVLITHMTRPLRTVRNTGTT